MKKIFTLLSLLLSCSLFAQFTAGNIALFVANTASSNNTDFSIAEISSSTANQSTALNTFSIPSTGVNALRTSGSATSTGYLTLNSDRTLLCFAAHNDATTGVNANTLTARGVGTLNAAGNYNLATTYTGTSGNQARGVTSLNNSTWFIADQGGVYTNSATTASPVANIRAVKSFGATVYVSQASSTATTIAVNILSAATGGTITGLPGITNQASITDYYLVSSGSNGNVYDVLYILTATNATAGTILKYSLVSGTWIDNGSYTTTFGGFGLCAIRAGSNTNIFVSTGAGATAANSVIKLVDLSGFNTAISITTASNVTLYTAAAGTTIKGISFTPGTIMPLNLSAFSASLKNGLSSISWNTTNETNVGFFEVERSSNGKDFSKAGTVKASNQNNNSYSFTDAIPIVSSAYYRLKMVEKDGSFRYSNIVLVNVKSNTSLNVYPNPARSSICVNHAIAEEGTRAIITSLDGKTVATANIAAASVATTINVTELSKGSYMVTVISGNQKQSTKFIKD